MYNNIDDTFCYTYLSAQYHAKIHNQQYEIDSPDAAYSDINFFKIYYHTENNITTIKLRSEIENNYSIDIDIDYLVELCSDEIMLKHENIYLYSTELDKIFSINSRFDGINPMYAKNNYLFAVILNSQPNSQKLKVMQDFTHIKPFKKTLKAFRINIDKLSTLGF